MINKMGAGGRVECGGGRRGRGELKCTLGTPVSPAAFLHTCTEVGHAVDVVCSEWGWILWCD